MNWIGTKRIRDSTHVSGLAVARELVLVPLGFGSVGLFSIRLVTATHDAPVSFCYWKRGAELYEVAVLIPEVHPPNRVRSNS